MNSVPIPGTPTLSADEKAEEIKFNKTLRVELDDAVKRLRSRAYGTPERTLAFRSLQQARHWLGEDLSILGCLHPYPNGKNPANTIVDPPADVSFPNTDKACIITPQTPPPVDNAHVAEGCEQFSSLPPAAPLPSVPESNTLGSPS